MVTISGIVYPLTKMTAPIYERLFIFKYQKTTGGTVYKITQSPFGKRAFSTTLQLNCQHLQSLAFELPESNLIQVDTLGGSGQLSPAFQIPVICTNNQTPPLPQRRRYARQFQHRRRFWRV